MQRIRWRNLELPTQVLCEESNKTYGRFVIEPFERGFGITIGNSLRRVLLASLEGTAVCNLKVSANGEPALHEYSSIPNVFEDIPDIILNLKGLLIEMDSIESAKLRIDVNKKGSVLASDIEPVANVRIIDPQYHICSLSEKTNLQIEMEVRRGRGYLTAEEHDRHESNEVGLIWIDSIFSPVRKVNYTIQNTRVGKITNYDKLVLHITTDATISPEMALVEASKILRKHLNPFVQYYELGVEVDYERAKESPEPLDHSFSPEIKEKLSIPIRELNLSNRALNCLEAERMNTAYDLVSHTEEDLLKIRNFGKNTLDEIQNCLKTHGLTLGMLKGSTL